MYILCFVFCSTQYPVRTAYVHNDRVCMIACFPRRLDKCEYEHYKWSVVSVVDQNVELQSICNVVALLSPQLRY